MRIRNVLATAFLLLPLGLIFPENAPLMVKEALQLELAGRLSEALDQYRSALVGESVLADDESLSKSLTIKVMSKEAHLAIDLGYSEEAWDLARKLLSVKTPEAAAAGTLIQARLLRLQGKNLEALRAIDDYTKAWSAASPGDSLIWERRLDLSEDKAKETSSSPIPKSGPLAWAVSGQSFLMASPSDGLGLKEIEATRLQVGAFKDWNHVVTLLGMLREKGWVPFTEVKVASGIHLHVVYLLSRQPQIDRAQLENQGLPVLP